MPEVDTEGPALLAELEEGQQECTPHTVRILELLKLKYGVGVFLSEMSTRGDGRRAEGSVSVHHLVLATWNHFQNVSEYENLEMAPNSIFSFHLYVTLPSQLLRGQAPWLTPSCGRTLLLSGRAGPPVGGALGGPWWGGRPKTSLCVSAAALGADLRCAENRLLGLAAACTHLDLWPSAEMCHLHGLFLCVCFCQEISSSDEITVKSGFPLLRQHSVSSLRQLMPFFRTLNCAFKAQSKPADAREPPLVGGPVTDSPRVLKQLEGCVESDFLEHLEC